MSVRLVSYSAWAGLTIGLILDLLENFSFLSCGDKGCKFLKFAPNSTSYRSAQVRGLGLAINSWSMVLLLGFAIVLMSS